MSDERLLQKSIIYGQLGNVRGEVDVMSLDKGNSI